VSSAVGALLAGSIADRLGRRLVVSISMFSAPLLMFVFLGVGGTVRLPVLLMLGLAVPATQVVLMALVQESCPENRALANGVFMSVTFISESAGAVVLGILGDLFGLRPAFATGAVVLLLGLPLVLLVPLESPAASQVTGAQ